MTSTPLYFRQLLSGRDFAVGDPLASQMVNFVYLVGDRETGEARQIQVLAQSGITPDEIAQMMQESAAYLAQRRQEEQDERSRQGIEVALAEFDRILPEAEARLERTTIAPAALTQARMTAERVRQVAREGNPSALEAEVSELRVITDTLRRTLG